METCIRLVVRVASHLPRTRNARLIIATKTVTIAIVPSRVILSASHGSCSNTGAGSGSSPRMLSKTIFVAAGGMRARTTPIVKYPSDQYSPRRLLLAICKKCCNNTRKGRDLSIDLRPDSSVGVSSLETGSFNLFLKDVNLCLLETFCFVIC